MRSIHLRQLTRVCVITIVFMGCQQQPRISEDDFLGALSIQRRVENQELVVTISAEMDEPSLWVKYDLFVTTSDGESQSLTTNKKPLQFAETTHRFQLEDLPEIDQSTLPVGIYYIVYRGEPETGTQLFCGSVRLESDAEDGSSSPEE